MKVKHLKPKSITSVRLWLKQADTSFKRQKMYKKILHPTAADWVAKEEKKEKEEEEGIVGCRGCPLGLAGRTTGHRDPRLGLAGRGFGFFFFFFFSSGGLIFFFFLGF
jgi:hypothetical protein